MNKKENEKIMIPMRPTETILGPYKRILELENQQDMDRSAITCRALTYVRGLGKETAIERIKAAAKAKLSVNVAPEEIPSSLKIKVDGDLLKEVEGYFREAFDLEKVQRNYLVKITLNAYIIYLEEDRKLLSSAENIFYGREETALTDMESVGLYVQMLMGSRKENYPFIERIKSTIMDWKDQNEKE